MCDFAPGDQVVCIDVSVRPAFVNDPMPLVEGQIYEVEGVFWDDLYEEAGLTLRGLTSTGYLGCFAACRFRKVQRRDLSVWLATEITIEEPKRAPVREPA